VHRFADPARLRSWAGLTGSHHESDTVVRRGHITKQSSKLVRCAGCRSHRAPTRHVEGRTGPHPDASHAAPKIIAKIAAARKLLTLVYYGRRDGHIRALASRRAG
jgi:transposase